MKTAQVTKAGATSPEKKIVPTVINVPANKQALAGKQARRGAPAAKKDRT